MQHHCKVFGATTLWLLAVLFMIEGSIEEVPLLRGWALLAAVGACMPTLWLIFDYNRNRLRDEMLAVLAEERGRAERLIQAIACEFARKELTDLDSRRSV